jgi:endonuclease G, mitochondrial
MRRRKKNTSGVAVFILLIVAASLAYAFYKGIIKLPRLPDLPDAPVAAQNGPAAKIDDSIAPEAAFALVGGFPKSKIPTEVLENTGYAAGYSETLLDPLWSAYYCGPDRRYEASDRSKIQFHPDDRLPAQYRLKTSDFKRRQGGYVTYDRGHMSPNYAIATRYGSSAQKETFLLTNIAPQRSELNQETWRYLEQRIAGTYAPEYDGVWVIVGPIFGANPVRYNGRAAIPEAFYCIILDRDEKTGKLRAFALVMDQTVSGAHTIGEFATTVRNVERETGLDFFSGLPDDVESALETSKPDSGWNWGTMLSGN